MCKLTKEERLKVADNGGYSKDVVLQTIKDDYFRTLAANGGAVSTTLYQLSTKYSRSVSGIKSILFGY